MKEVRSLPRPKKKPSACDKCHETKERIHWDRKRGKWLCTRCWQWAEAAECSVCHQIKPINGRDDNNQPLCGACDYRRRVEESGDPVPWGTCPSCQEPNQRLPFLSQPGYLDSENKPLKAGQRICWVCYDQNRAEEPCGLCGVTRKVHTRTKRGARRKDGSALKPGLPVCNPCYQSRLLRKRRRR